LLLRNNLLFASDTLLLEKVIPIKASLLQVDAVGNFYVVLKNNTLVRYNSNGDSTGFFNEIKKGKISLIDASNPLRLLLFYADYGNIVLLDQMLSLKNRISLHKKNIYHATQVAISADGGIWVYDPASTQLLKIDEKLNIRYTNQLNQTLKKNLQLTCMLEHHRTLFVSDIQEDIFKFDLYGFYLNQYHITPLPFQVYENNIVYYDKNILHSYNFKTLEEKKLILPVKNILSAKASRNKIYIHTSNAIYIYKLN